MNLIGMKLRKMSDDTLWTITKIVKDRRIEIQIVNERKVNYYDGWN